jgi:hypothetical protein
VDQGGVVPAGGPGKDAGARGVDGMAEAFVGLCRIDVGISGAVDDGADLVFREEMLDGATVADVEDLDTVFFPDIREQKLRLSLRQQAEFGAELPEGAGNQYFLHRYTKNLCKDKN